MRLSERAEPLTPTDADVLQSKSLAPIQNSSRYLQAAKLERRKFHSAQTIEKAQIDACTAQIDAERGSRRQHLRGSVLDRSFAFGVAQ